MAQHNLTGKQGEDLAVDFLISKGFIILERNWRYSHWEIDVIAAKDKLLHVIEVKTQTSIIYGYPERKVTDKKLKSLSKAVEKYLEENPQWQIIQYDILSVFIKSNSAHEFFFMEDIDIT